MDVMNTLGLSTSLMGVIERRQKMDRWFVYLGIVICCLFMYSLRATLTLVYTNYGPITYT